MVAMPVLRGRFQGFFGGGWFLLGSRIVFLAVLGYLLSSLLRYAKGGDAAGPAFGLIRLIKTSPPFSDLLWVMVVGKCGTKTARLSDSVSAVCDHYGYAQSGGGYGDTGYPDMVNSLVRIFDSPVGYSGFIGLVAGIFFVIAIMLSSKRLFRSHWAWPVSMSVVLISFPVELLLERANLDVFIYLMMVASSVVISLGGGFLVFLPLAFLVFLAVALKAFPVFGFMGWLLSSLSVSREYRANTITKLAVALGCAIGMVFLIPWAISTGKDIGFSGGLASFGFKALGYINVFLVDTFGIDRARILIKALVLTKLVSIAVGVVLAIRASLAEKVYEFFGLILDPFFKKFSVNLFVLMTWTWLGAYLVSISFDYKHVFLLPSMLVFFAVLESRGVKTRFQFWVLASLVGLGLFITFFPFIVFANLLAQNSFVRLTELMGEVVVIPIYAGALGAILGLPLIKSVFRSPVPRL